MKCFSASFVFLLFVNSLKNVAPAAANAFLNPNTVDGYQHVDMTPESRSGSKDVIIQMFEWTWDSVASECTNFIGPSGYGYVQVSPAQEHVTGDQWWTDYQPVSYILTSKRGNRTQFSNMITTCHAAGVKVIADAIFNHMTGGSGIGVAGSPYTHYVYPGTYEAQDFHYCGLEPNNDIVDYENRLEVQTCQLVGLADLATDTDDYVRGRLAEYANDLLSLGVDGLRLDAAKHIAATDLANITSRFTSTPYITQEVIWGSGEPIQPSEYVDIGSVQEFRYTNSLKDAFLGGGISSLENLDNQGWVPGTKANVFVTNHDTERVQILLNGNSLNSNSPSNTYITAMIFSLAHPYGTPTILSSYYGFTDTDAGAPNGGVGTCTGTCGRNGWLCQHRWTAISGMTGFRNTVGEAPITNWVSPQSNQIAFGRGSAGFVAINNDDFAWSTTFTTSFADGSYCDVISGNSASGSCTGTSFSVSNGSLTATVPARSAIAIYTGATGAGRQSNSVSVAFSEIAITNFGENIFIVGSIPQLGSWAPDSAITMSSANYPNWMADIILPANTAFEYKFIRKEPGGSIVWESDPNRQATTALSGTQTICDSWR
ncbi:carbohydrate-binding module family 20 protein [Piloderma croceum F 1598]|uniref:Alpha-amylase n=1 Tax=Piloderma croceum (strain F 1598) TaxID=765440 RepID=A0A0C3GFG2_PILCF|nr:carbohydrate-binding module family 20 protein [Piloderma croceum F 1598]